jgi:mRNA interferase MazF
MTSGPPLSPKGRRVPIAFRAGQIVVADWRKGALPREPNKQRPAVVVEQDGMFDPDWPTVILIPLADDPTLVIPSLAVRIEPTPENSCPKPCWALAQQVTVSAKKRVRPTDSFVTPEQLADIRRKIGMAVGIFAEIGPGAGQVSITGAPVGLSTR